MTSRKKIPIETESELIYLTDFKCCVCQNDTRGDHIHHIDGNRNNNNLDNLSFLCFLHHDEASKKSLSRRLSAGAIKKYRDKWHEEIKELRQKRREVSNNPISEISEEHLLKASLSASIILKIINIKEKYFYADWYKKKEILTKIHRYAEYSNFRISYEVFLFLSHAASETRDKIPLEIISAIYWIASAFYISEEGEKENIITNEIINIGSDMIYNGTIYSKDLNAIAYGCNLLKLVYQHSLKDTQKHIKEKVLNAYNSLEKEFSERQENENAIFEEMLQIFKDDLDKWGLAFPPFPSHISKEIFK